MKLRFLHPLPIYIVLSFSNIHPVKNNVFWSGILEVEGGVGRLQLCVVCTAWGGIVALRAGRVVAGVLRRGLETPPIPGSPQDEREGGLAAFASGAVRCLVATDLAARLGFVLGGYFASHIAPAPLCSFILRPL